MGVDTALNPFSIRPSYQALLQLPAAERLKRLADPAMRARLGAEVRGRVGAGRLAALHQEVGDRDQERAEHHGHHQRGEDDDLAAFSGSALADPPHNLILFVPDGLRAHMVTPQTAPAMAANAIRWPSHGPPISSAAVEK